MVVTVLREISCRILPPDHTKNRNQFRGVAPHKSAIELSAKLEVDEMPG